MDLIIGGAYQGKLAYAKQHFSLSDEQIYTCTEAEALDFKKPCINKLEEYTLWCVRNSVDALKVFRENHSKWEKSVLICCDIFCGVVPLGADMRAWREMTGKLCAYLSREADSVTRVFCGIGQRLK